MDQFGGLVNVSGWNPDVAVLDYRPGILRSHQPAAQFTIDDMRIAQGGKRLMSGRSLSFRSGRQSRELHSGLSKLGDEVLHPPQSTLDCLHTVVCVEVIRGVERLLELPQVKVSPKCGHRALQSGVLAREVLKVTDDVAPPALHIRLAWLRRRVHRVRRSAADRSPQAQSANGWHHHDCHDDVGRTPGDAVAATDPRDLPGHAHRPLSGPGRRDRSGRL